MIRHLGQEWARKVILTADKTLVSGAVLIDDKPKITGAPARPDWKQTIDSLGG